MSSAVILVVEDDRRLRVLLARTLQQNGYTVQQAGSATEMWSAFEAGPIDLVLLDIMLPGRSGIDLCREIRHQNTVPIIFISARSEEADRVVGLEVGADDYLAKPLGARELLARIRAVLRRTQGGYAAGSERCESLEFDGWRMDLRRRCVTSPTGASIDLTGAEFDLLASFLGSPQRVLGRDRLIELSRVRLAEASDRSIDVLVSRLRRKLWQAGQPAPIVTVRGIGYMLTAEVTRG